MNGFKSIKILQFVFHLLLPLSILGQHTFPSDTFQTDIGEVKLTLIGHGSLMFEMNDFVIHVDPSRSAADYKLLPKANLILITHQHRDHCDPFAIEDVALANAKIITTKSARDVINKGDILYNYQSTTVNGIQIDAVPAYNIGNSTHHEMYHPKGEGNGYVLTIGSKRFYVAGDTDNIPEMKDLKKIDVAFMPMNLPHTMSPEMVADGISKFHPKILYPYHHRGTNINKLFLLLNNDHGTEVRIRKIY